MEFRRAFPTVTRNTKGIAMAKPGINGRAIHERVQEILEDAGFEADAKAAATGGLKIHESPRISMVDAKLKEGQVVTIEPGLYYRAARP